MSKKEQPWRRLPLPEVPMPIFALATDRQQIWAGGVGGIASYSLAADQGDQSEWMPGLAGLPLSAVTALLARDSVLLAGGSEGIAYSFTSGQSWQQAQLEDGIASITALVASPEFEHDQRVVAATLANGILRTEDGGRNWMNASFGLESLEVSALCWKDRSTLLAATSDGIYRSRDSARSWRRLYAGEDGEGVEVEALVVADRETLLAALSSGELLVSHDGGMFWDISQPAPGAQGLSLCVTSTGAVLYGTLEQGLLRSEDRGETWQTVHSLTAHVCIQSPFAPRDRTGAALYAGHDTGVSVSYDDGRSWSELTCPPLHDLRVIQARGERLILTGPYSGIHAATPDHAWRYLLHVETILNTCVWIDDDTLLFSSISGLEQLSFDTGARKMLLAGAAGEIAHIAQRREGAELLLWIASSDGARLLSSPNGGANWEPLRTPFGILPLVAFQAVADRLVAATYDPRQFQVCFWHSIDEGHTWMRSLEAATRWPVVATCAQPPALSIGNILFLEQSAGRWQQVMVGKDGGAIRRVLGFQRAGVSSLLVLTTTGIQRSDDQGLTWRYEHEGLPVEHIMDLTLSDSTLSVLLTGGRVWQREL